MNNIQELLRRKEEELLLAQKEVEALRLVIRMMEKLNAPVETAARQVPVVVDTAPRPAIRAPQTLAAESPASYPAFSQNIPRQFP